RLHSHSMKKLSKYFLYTFAAGLLLLAGLAGGAWYWVVTPVPMQTERVDYHVEPGSSPRRAVNEMREAGIDINGDLFVALARISGRDVMLTAGAYEAVRGDSPWKLLDRMATGDMTQVRLTLVEGWTYQRFRQVLRDNPAVKQTL